MFPVGLVLGVTAGLAQPPAWKSGSGDVRAEQVVSAAPDDVLGRVDDLRELASLIPERCAKKWAYGATTQGSEATARVSLVLGPVAWRHTLVFGRRDLPGIVEFEHLWRAGFVSQVRTTDLGNGSTNVEYTTYYDLPPWPFKRVYVFKVQPAWKSCHEETLQNLANSLR